MIRVMMTTRTVDQCSQYLPGPLVVHLRNQGKTHSRRPSPVLNSQILKGALELHEQLPRRRIIRIFISSPADVRPERLVAERVIKRMAREFSYHFDVKPLMWEREPLLASAHFQDLIISPHEVDIVVVILWSRLGATLPTPKYLGPVSGRPVTGTEFEFEDALAGYHKNQLPDLLLYRKQLDITVKLGNRSYVEEQQRQTELVEDFMRRWTRDAEGKGFTAAFWPFSDGTAFDAQLEEHLRGLLLKRVTGTEFGSIRWYQGSPYRGLESFELEHEQIFFGRTRARAEVRELLERQVERGLAFVLVMGASGSGKSSLVKAGIVPDLCQAGMIGHVGLVRAVMTRPSAATDPLDGLAVALLGALPELSIADSKFTAERLTTLLRRLPEEAVAAIDHGLGVAGQTAELTATGEARLLVVVDQLEELFTIEGVTDEARRQYVAALDALARSGLAWVVATMRSDFFGHLERLPELAKLAVGEGKYLLNFPDTAEIAQIVRQPAREAGLHFENDVATGRGLDDEILATAAGTASLPLLEYVLDQLWSLRSENGALTFDAYRTLGGLEGAVGARAEQVLKGQPAEVQAVFPRLLRALVTVGPGTQASVTASYADIEQFERNGPERKLIEALVNPTARLLVIDGRTIRIAHEALLSHWPRARDQIAEDRSDLQLRALLEDGARRWRGAPARDQGSLVLPTGLPLSEAEDLLKRRREELASNLIDFIEVSARVARIQQQRRIWRLQAVAVVMLFLLVGTITGGFIAWSERNAAEQNYLQAQTNEMRASKEALRAEQNAQRVDSARIAGLIAEANRMAALSEQLNNSSEFNLAAAIVLSEMPLGEGDERPVTRQLEAALRRGLEAASYATQRFIGGNVLALATSRDGKVVAASTSQGVVYIFEAKTLKEILRFALGKGMGDSLYFSPDGDKLVTSGKGIPTVWSISQKRKLFDLDRPNARPFSKRAQYSSDGMRIIVGTAENRALIYDAADGKLLFVLPGSTYEEMRQRLPEGQISFMGASFAAYGSATDAVFSPDGKLAAVTAHGNIDGSVRLYDTNTGELIRILSGKYAGGSYIVPNTSVVAFSENGSRLIRSARSIEVWNVADGRLRVDLPADALGPSILTRDGNALLIGQENGTIVARCIDERFGVVNVSMQAHSGPVTSLTVDRSGLFLVSGSSDRSARVWRFPDGLDVCITNDNAGKLSQWSLHKPLRVFSGHGAGVSGVEFTDGLTSILTISLDGYLRKWRMHPPDILRLPARGRDCRFIITSSALNGFIRESFDAFSRDGENLLINVKDRPFGFNLSNGNSFEILSNDTPGLRSLTGLTSPDGSRAVVTANIESLSGLGNAFDSKRVTYRLIERETGRELAVLTHKGKPAEEFYFSADGSRLFGTFEIDQPPGREGSGGGIAVWDVRSGALVASVDSLPSFRAGYTLQLSNDGRRLVIVFGNRVMRVFEVANDRILQIGSGSIAATVANGRHVTAAALLPDGRGLIIGHNDGYVSIQSVGANPQLVGSFYTRRLPITLVSLASDGRHFAVADESNTVWIFDRERVSTLRSITLRDAPYLLRFTPESKRLVVGDCRLEYQILPVEPGIPGLAGVQELADWARALHLVTIDDEDRRRYGLTAPGRNRRPDLEAIKPRAAAQRQSDLPLGRKAYACDIIADNPLDRNRRTPGVYFEHFDAAAARPTCIAAQLENPEDLVTRYHIARIQHRLGEMDNALQAYIALSEEGYAKASMATASMILEDETGNLARRLGSHESWEQKAADQGDPVAIVAGVKQIALTPDAIARTAEILSELETAGIANRADAALLTFLQAAGSAQSEEQKANVLFFGLLGLDWAESIDDPVPRQMFNESRLALDLVRDFGAELPASVVVKTYRDARAWRGGPDAPSR